MRTGAVSAMGEFIVVAIVVVVVLLLVLTGMPGRRREDKEERVCKTCRLSHPYFATFCRRCGGKL